MQGLSSTLGSFEPDKLLQLHSVRMHLLAMFDISISAILKNIDIDKGILQNIDIDRILNQLEFGISIELG